tara:strand:+ start:427 stop:1398 length:972 start_codon:yes stop_codon:yes gene_type:complete
MRKLINTNNYERTSCSKSLVNDPVDFDELKKAIFENGPILVYHPDTGLETCLHITPCPHCLNTCSRDVIIVEFIHGITHIKTEVKKHELVESKSVSHFLNNVFHHTEAYFCSSTEEQLIERHIQDKLGINPFNVYCAEDQFAEIKNSVDHEKVKKLEFWQAHTLMTLLRTLNVKRQLMKIAQSNEKIDLDEFPDFILDTFDMGFLAGRLYSEYKSKVDLEEIVEVGERSIQAQDKRTSASGKKSSNSKTKRLESFMHEIEQLGDLFPRMNADAIEDQAFDNAVKKDPNLWSQGLGQKENYLSKYIRSEDPWKSRYSTIFYKIA